MSEACKHCGAARVYRCGFCERCIMASVPKLYDELAAERHRREAAERERDELQRSLNDMTRSANGLYQAIINRLEPFFPPDTRDLEWDVLPGTIRGIAGDRDELQERLHEANRKVNAAQTLNSNQRLMIADYERVCESNKKCNDDMERALLKAEADRDALQTLLSDAERERYELRTEVERLYRDFVKNDTCPRCLGELDTGWECNKCGYDAAKETTA